jgi:hypothetical protein
MPGRLNDRAAQSLVLSAQPASAINVHEEAARSAASFIFKQADHVAYWQIPFQAVSDAARSGGNRPRSLGRGSGGLAGRHRPKFGVRARLKEGAGAVSHD